MGNVVSLFIVLILAISVFAESKDSELNSRYKHLDCKAQFVLAHVDALSSVSSADLTEKKNALVQDMAELEKLSTGSDKKAFDSLVKEEIKSDFKDLAAALRDAKKDVRKDLTGEQKASLKALLKDAKAAFADCTNSAEEKLLKLRIDHFNELSANWNEAIKADKAKGIDTTGMETVAAKIPSKMIPVLEEAVKSVDSSKRRAALESVRNLNLHIWANFAIARSRAHLAKLSNVDKQKVAAISKLLSDAAVRTKEGMRYAEGDFEKVWNNLKKAVDETRSLEKGGSQ